MHEKSSFISGSIGTEKPFREEIAMFDRFTDRARKWWVQPRRSDALPHDHIVRASVARLIKEGAGVAALVLEHHLMLSSISRTKLEKKMKRGKKKFVMVDFFLHTVGEESSGTAIDQADL